MSFARFLAAGHVTVGSDIVQRITPAPYWLWREADFLDLHAVAQTNIVMNPPFFRAKGAEAFIRHAFKLATGKVAAFVDLKFLAGSSRANGLYAEMPPDRVWMITPRPSCPPGEYLQAGNTAGGGTADWVWLVWDIASPTGETSFGWLRRDM